MYHIMTDLPETVPYICVKCDPVRPAKWQVELEEEMEAGFQNVLRAMLNCRSASHLVNLEKKVITVHTLENKTRCSNTVLSVGMVVQSAVPARVL